MKVKLIAKTVICDPDLLNELKDSSPEQLIMYCARVSNPENQLSGKPGLLNYCSNHGHWSIFEQSDLTFEITTSRAIAAQILRHKSAFFQEFSQRYAQVQSFETYEARRQDNKNRQNSIADMSEEDSEWFNAAQREVYGVAYDNYIAALNKGIAKEQARFLLPLSTTTKLYMKNNIRNWIHYLNVRCDISTQKEHRDIANAIKEIFIKECPIIAEALQWKEKT